MAERQALDLSSLRMPGGGRLLPHVSSSWHRYSCSRGHNSCQAKPNAAEMRPCVHIMGLLQAATGSFLVESINIIDCAGSGNSGCTIP